MQKSIDDLRKQILDVDTARSNLGKFVIQTDIITIKPIVNESSDNFPDKTKYNKYIDNKTLIVKKLESNIDSSIVFEFAGQKSTTSGTLPSAKYSLKALKEVRFTIQEGFIGHITAKTDSAIFVYSKPIPVVALINIL